MYPMIAGLSSLLTDEDLFQFVEKNGSKSAVSRSDVLKQLGLDQTDEKAKKVKIAVLTNERTGSSGEMTVLAFKGLESVKIILVSQRQAILREIIIINYMMERFCS